MFVLVALAAPQQLLVLGPEGGVQGTLWSSLTVWQKSPALPLAASSAGHAGTACSDLHRSHLLTEAGCLADTASPAGKLHLRLLREN